MRGKNGGNSVDTKAKRAVCYCKSNASRLTSSRCVTLIQSA